MRRLGPSLALLLVVSTADAAPASMHYSGIAPAEALRMVTLGNARIMKRDGHTGSIAPGMAADWLLVDGDPTQQISDIRRTVLVSKSGVLYSPAAIYRSVGIRPASR